MAAPGMSLSRPKYILHGITGKGGRQQQRAEHARALAVA